MKENDGYTYWERLGPKSEGVELLDWLSERYTHSKRETWLERILQGQLRIDGAIATPTTRLVPGRELAWERPPWLEGSVPKDFQIIHEDDDLLVVSKPSGLPTMPAGNFYQNTLWYLVRSRWPEAHPLHRLGRGTSGLLVFGKKSQASRRLSAAFREGRIERVYLTVVVGIPPWKTKTIRAPIGAVPHSALGTVHGASEAGSFAESRLRILAHRDGASLAEVELGTGRPHQIRIHMAHAGHPLLGDPLFGVGGVPKSDALPGDGGYLLHASRLAFTQPSTGERLEVSAPSPPAFAPWLEALASEDGHDATMIE